MPENTLPDLQKQKFSREHLILEYRGRRYVMLDWPIRIYGPAFEKFGDKCIGCYIIPVTPGNVPSDKASLAIWPDARAFELNDDPAAILDTMSLVDPAEKTQAILEKIQTYKQDKEQRENNPDYFKNRILELSDKITSLIEIANACEDADIDLRQFDTGDRRNHIGLIRSDDKITDIGLENHAGGVHGLCVNSEGVFAWTRNESGEMEISEPLSEHMAAFLKQWYSFEAGLYDYITDTIANGLK